MPAGDDSLDSGEEQACSPINAALCDRLNQLASPDRRIEGIREILRLMHDLTVAELHNAHGVCWLPLVGDGVFGDPEVTRS